MTLVLFETILYQNKYFVIININLIKSHVINKNLNMQKCFESCWVLLTSAMIQPSPNFHWFGSILTQQNRD